MWSIRMGRPTEKTSRSWSGRTQPSSTSLTVRRFLDEPVISNAAH